MEKEVSMGTFSSLRAIKAKYPVREDGRPRVCNSGEAVVKRMETASEICDWLRENGAFKATCQEKKAGYNITWLA